MISNKEVRSLAVLAESQGWVVDHSGGKHIAFLSPKGDLVTVARTPSDHRSLRNSAADLRRAGLEVPRKAPRKRAHATSPANEMIARAAEEAEFDLQVDTYPFVTATLGQWRDCSWFSEEGLPLTEENWSGPDEKRITETMMVAYLMISDTKGDFVKLTEADRLPPIGRRKRIWVESVRFWAISGAPPQECACGFTGYGLNTYERMFALAEHVYNKHERGDTAHEPVGPQPWMEPDDLIEQVLSDEQDRIIELTRQVEILAASLSVEQQEHRKFKEALRRLVQ